MQKLFYISVLFSLLIAGCSKKYIELAPQSAASVDALYKTDKDFQDAVVGCYSVLQTQYQNWWLFGDVRADDSWQQVVKNSTQYFMDVFTLDNTSSLLNDSWNNYYNLISRANLVLAKIAGTDTAIVKNKTRHIAEAKFLRAFAYFDLVRIFGDVPMVTTNVTIADSYKIGRTKLDKIYDSVIIPGLVDAEAGLPAKYTGTDVGRATKGAARALLGRVYLTRKDFANAEIRLQQVTTMGYALLPDFNSLYDYSKDEHHSEYIFDVEYESGIGAGSQFTNDFMPNSSTMAAFYGVAGVLQEWNSPTQTLINLFDPADKRMGITVASGGYTNGSGSFVPLPPQTSQTYTKKFLFPVATANDSRANWKVIRYADVLLMYAEALNENGKTPDALTWLNQVRARAGMPAYSGLSQSDCREKIYVERRLELSFEGVRWFDLVRTGRALSTMQSAGMKDYMTIFPIPLTQIQLINNPTLFPQNPGWN